MVNIPTQLVADLGDELRVSLGALVARTGEALPSPTSLSRTWGLDRTLCSRVMSALREREPLRVVHLLPAIQSLRALIEAATTQGVVPEVLTPAAEAVDRLEDLIRRIGGKKNLDTVIGGQDFDTRERTESGAKQSVFRGMSSLLGVQAGLSLTTFFVYPSDRPDHYDLLGVYGIQNLRRLRPELPNLAGGRVLTSEPSPEFAKEAEQALRSGDIHTGELDAGYTIALKDFCSDPFPPIQVVREGQSLRYILPGEPAADPHEVSMIFASLDRNLGTSSEPGGHFRFVPRNPARDMLLDVFVQNDIWNDLEPRVEISRGDRTLTEGQSSEYDLVDVQERVESVGNDPRRFGTEAFPRYEELLAHIREKMGWAAERFRLYRLHIRYPVVGLSYIVRLGPSRS